MTLLNRYILRTFSRFFSLSLGTFVGIYLVIDFFGKSHKFIEHHAAISQVFWYFFDKIPLIAVRMTPLAVLMAVFMTLGSFSRTNELTAMRSGGVSLWRISTPLLLVSVLIALSVMATSEYVVPLCFKKINYIMDTEVQGQAEPVFKRDRLWLREGNDIVYIRLALPDKGTLEGISVFEMGKGFRLRSRIDAARAVFIGKRWKFERVTIRDFDPGTGTVQKVRHLPQKWIDLGKKPKDFRITQQDNKELGFRALHRIVKKLRAEGYDATRYRVDMQSRLAMPFANVIMAFLGIPFALKKGRNTSLAVGVAITVAIGIAYHFLQAMMMTFGYTGVLSPLAAAWSAHLLFGLFGVWLLLQARE